MTESTFKKNKKKILFFYLLLLLFITLIAAEFILSLLPKRNIDATYSREVRLREHAPFDIKFLTPGELALSRTDSLPKKEYRFEIDRDGFIFPSEVHEKADLNILFLGGSTTECIYVDEDKRFPYLIGQILEEKRGLKVNSYNSGVGGNHSMHSINIFLNKGLQLKPKVVIMMHNINDLVAHLVFEKTYWNDHYTRSLVKKTYKVRPYGSNIKNMAWKSFPNVYMSMAKVKDAILSNSQNSTMNDEFAEQRNTKKIINKNKILNGIRKNLETFINISKIHKIKPVLMTQANRFLAKPDPIIVQNWTLNKDYGISYDEFREVYLEINEMIIKICKVHEIDLIDLAARIPADKKYMYDSVHFNNHGSVEAAEIISDELLKIIGSN